MIKTLLNNWSSLVNIDLLKLHYLFIHSNYLKHGGMDDACVGNQNRKPPRKEKISLMNKL